MLTGEAKGQNDRIWDAFWSGGISNPLEVMEQITYLLFLKRLDELHTLALNKANTLGKPIEGSVFPAGNDELRWSVFKDTDAKTMYETLSDKVFPFLRNLGGEDSTYSTHMRDARFTIPTPILDLA